MMKELKNDLLAVLGIVLVYIVMMSFGITCPIRFLTGVSCAGCGMSRACLAALRFDFKTAFSYHPLFFIVPPMALLVIFRKKIPEKLFNLFLYLFVVAMLICYIIRMMNPADTIVVFEPEKSLVFKVFRGMSSK